MEPKPQTRVVASSLGDIAAALPTMFGFRPDNSIVAMCLDTRTNRLLMNMRLDMPDNRADMVEAAQVIASHINSRPEMKALLFAVTHDDRAARNMVSLIEVGIGPQNLVGAARVHGDRYWDLEDLNPAEGRPLGKSDFAEQLAAANSLTGRRIYNSRADMEKSFDPAPHPALRATGEAIITVVSEFEATREERGTDAAIETLRDIATNELDKLIDDPATFTPNTAAWLNVAAGINSVRDTLWRQIKPDNALRHAEAWRLTATHAPGSTGAGAYALAGFASWLAGDGAKALVAVEHARGAEPSHNLARLTELAVTSGLNPVKWQGFAAERS